MAAAPAEPRAATQAAPDPPAIGKRGRGELRWPGGGIGDRRTRVHAARFGRRPGVRTVGMPGVRGLSLGLWGKGVADQREREVEFAQVALRAPQRSLEEELGQARPAHEAPPRAVAAVAGSLAQRTCQAPWPAGVRAGDGWRHSDRHKQRSGGPGGTSKYRSTVSARSSSTSTNRARRQRCARIVVARRCGRPGRSHPGLT